LQVIMPARLPSAASKHDRGIWSVGRWSRVQ
jgi:hypothetical protein